MFIKNVRNKENIKCYNCLFVITALMFFIILFCFFGRVTVNADSVDTTVTTINDGKKITLTDVTNINSGYYYDGDTKETYCATWYNNDNEAYSGHPTLKFGIYGDHAICLGLNDNFNGPSSSSFSNLKIKIPWKIKINDKLFRVLGISDKAFADNKYITEIDLWRTDYLGRSSFQNCTNLVSLKFYENTSIKIIPKYCFANTNINYINIPCSVQTIDEGAFHGHGAYAINIGYNSRNSEGYYSELSNINFGVSSGGGTAANPLWGYRLERITINNSLDGCTFDRNSNDNGVRGYTAYRVKDNVLYEIGSNHKNDLKKVVLYPTYNFKGTISSSSEGAYRFTADGSLYNGYGSGNDSIITIITKNNGVTAGLLKNNTEVYIIDTASDTYATDNHTDDLGYAVNKNSVYWVSYWFNPTGTTKESDKVFAHVHIRGSDILYNVNKKLPNSSSFSSVSAPSFYVESSVNEICDEAFRQVAFLSSVKIPTTINRIGEFAFYCSSNSMLARKFFLSEIIFYDPNDNDKTISGSALAKKLLDKVGRNSLELSGSNSMAMDKISNGGLSGTGKTNSFFSNVLSKVVEGYYAENFKFNLKPVKNAYTFDDFIALVEENYHNSNTENYGKDVKQSTSDDLNGSLGLYKWSAWTNAEQTEAITEIDTSFSTEDKPRKYFIVYDNSGSMGAYPGDSQPFTKNLITHALIKHLSDEILSANSENKLGITAAWREYDPEIDNSIYKADTAKGVHIGSKDNPYLYAWRKIAKAKDGNDDGFISATSAGSDDNAKAAVSEYLNHIAGETFGDTNYYTPLRDVAKLIGSKDAGEAAPVVIFIADGATTNFGCFSSNVTSYVEDETKVTEWKNGSTTGNDWFDGATPSVEGHAWTRFSESGVAGSLAHAKEELEHLRNDYFVANGIQARSIVVGTNDSNGTLKSFVGGDPNYCAEIADMTDFTKKINSIVSTTSGTVVLRDVIDTSNFKIQTKTLTNGKIVPDIEFLLGGTNSKYDGVAAPGAPTSLKINSDLDVEGNGWKLVSDGNSNYMNSVTFDSENYTNKTIAEIEQAIRDESKTQNNTEAEILLAIQQEIGKIKGVHIPYKCNNNTNRVNRIRIKTTLTDDTKTGTSIKTNGLYHDSSTAGGAKNTSLTFADGAANEGEENYVESPALKRYAITINKKDTDGKVVADAQFNIKDSSDNILKFKEVEKDDGSWYYVYTDKNTDNVEGCPVTDTLVADDKGQINVYALPVATPDAPDKTSATFSIVETWAPHGYSKAAPVTITVGGENAVASQTVDIVDEIATRSISLTKCFEVGNLTFSEVLEKAKLLNFKIEGTKVNNSTFTSATYNVVDDKFSYTFSYTNNYSHKYVLFYKTIKVPAGNYTVTEEIADNSFFDNKAVYVANQNISYINDSIIAELLRGNKKNSVDVDLTSSSVEYVTFLNNLKTTDLTIDKTVNSTDFNDFDGYYFEVEGTTLLKEKFVWEVCSDTTIKKYSVNSKEERTLINDALSAEYDYGAIDTSAKVQAETYKIENIPYSTSGYTVKEIITSNNFDAGQTKTYTSKDNFKNDTNGRVGLSTTASASNGFYAGFRNVPVGSIKVEKTAEDNVVEGLKFTVEEVNNASKSYTATTDSSGIATFNNLPVFDTSGNYIEYEIKETTPTRYDTVVYKKGTATLSESKDDYYYVGNLAVGRIIDISVENKLKKGAINIEKYYNGNNTDSSEKEHYSNIHFVLTQKDSYGKTIDTVDIYTDEKGCKKIANLPIYDANNEPYEYEVTEDSNIASKYSSVAYSLEGVSDIGSSESFNLVDPIEVTVYVNNIKNSNLIIEKKDTDTGELLGGAEFKICRKGSTTALSFDYDSENASYNYNSNGTSTVVTSSASAPILVCGLATGEYEITETKAPNNYEITERDPKTIEIKKNEKNDAIGASVTFYDKLKTRTLRIYKCAEDCISGIDLSTLNAFRAELKKTKFKISGTSINGSQYEEIIEMSNAANVATMNISNSSGEKTYVYGVRLNVNIPYGSYKITEVETTNKYDLNSVISKVLVSSSLSESGFKAFLESEPSNVLENITIDENFSENDRYVFYNQLKRCSLNIYKAINASTLEQALATAKDTSFTLSGGIDTKIPSITKIVNGNIELNTSGGWSIDNESGIYSFGKYYCFKYTVDNVKASQSVFIQEHAGENCDKTLSRASTTTFASSSQVKWLYNEETKQLDAFEVQNLEAMKDKSVYFLNSPKRASLLITKSANMFTAPDNIPDEITKEVILNSLKGIEFKVSGTTYLGEEINLTVPVDSTWWIDNNPDNNCYYVYTYVLDEYGYDLPAGNYTIEEIAPSSSDFVLSKTKSKVYDMSEYEYPEEYSYYSDIEDDYNISSVVSCDTTTGNKTASFYNIKDYVKLTLNKYSDELYPHNGSGNFGLTDAINLLNGTKFLISGDTEADQEYSKEIIINEENKDLFRLLYDGSGFYLQYTMDIPRGNYTIKEVESPNYDLSKTTSIFKNMDNRASYTSNASLSFDLTNTINQNSSNFSCSFNNFASTTNLTIYKVLDYTGFNYGSMLTDKDKQEIKDLFKDLKFTISCETFYGTYVQTLETNNQNEWIVDCYLGRPRIRQTVAVPIGKCTITETAADGTNTHNYFDLSKTSVAKNMSGAFSANSYANSITETYTKNSKFSKIYFANRLKTKQIKVALFGEGANSITAAKELLDNTQFEIKANSTISGVPYGTRKITFNKNNLSDTLTVDTDNIKLETYTDNNSSTYAGFAYAEITVPEGNYSVTELSSNSVYDLSKTSYSWNAQNAISGSNVGTTYTKNVSSAANATAKTFSFYFYNRYALGDIVVEKIDSETKAPIKDVEFELRNKNYQVLKFKEDTTSTADDPVYVLDEASGSSVLKTGNNGKFTVKNMTYGSYYVFETNPTENYVDSGNSAFISLTSPTVTKTIENTLKQETLRIVKAAEDIDEDTDDVNAVLKDLSFTIQGTKKNGAEYEKNITIDGNISLTKSSINNSSYVFFDVTVPVGQYTVSEDTSNVEKYASDRVCVADSVEKIIDENSRTLGNSIDVTVNAINTNTKEDSNNSEVAATACFYNPLNYVKLQLCKYVPNVVNTDNLKSLLSGTKFIIESKNSSSYYQEYTIDKDNFIWVPISSSTIDNVLYKGYKLASTIVLPAGTYDVSEVPNDSFDASKTKVGYSLSHALANAPRTSFEITMTKTDTTYNRTFVNYPTTKTVRLAKVANNTFDSITDKQVYTYLNGIEFKFEDAIFGDNGYNETIAIDSSWTIGKSNGYKYLYKDIDVPVSSYTITETFGSNVYYDAELSETHYANTLAGVLDASKRESGRSATLNVAEGVEELYFFNTAKPTKLILSKAVEGNISYSSLFKLIAGTQFVMTNKTTGFNTTITVPDKSSSIPDELGGTWGAWAFTGSDGKTYTRVHYVVTGLAPGNYEIKEIPNENFDPSRIYVSNSSANAIKNKTDNNPSDTYSFAMSKPFVEGDSNTTSYVTFLNTLDTKTIRVSKVANNTFANLQDSTILNYLNGLQFDINNTLISGEGFSKTVTIDNTWSVATSGHYKYAYKDIEVPAGIYTVEESIGSNTTFNAELAETYYQTSVENVLDETKRQQGTSGTINASDSSNEICFFNTAGPVKLVIYKAVQGSLSKTAMVDLVKGTKFEIKNNITNTLTTVTVGDDACGTVDEYGRKWGYFTKTGNDGNVYTLLQYVIEGFDPSQYNIKEIPNDNFIQSEIRVDTSLNVAIGSQPKDNIGFTAHKSTSTYSSIFLNTLANKTVRIYKFADNIKLNLSSKQIHSYLNGLEFNIKDTFFGEDKYNETVTIDDTWTVTPSNDYKYIYIYKDFELPASKYSITESIDLTKNIYYDPNGIYVAESFEDIVDSDKRTLGSSNEVSLINVENANAFFYNTQKSEGLSLQKYVPNIATTESMFNFVNGTKFVITGITDPSFKQEIVVSASTKNDWVYFPTTSSETNISYYGMKLKTPVKLPTGKYNVEEVPNDNTDVSKTRVSWSLVNAELDSSIRTSYPITILAKQTNTTAPYARYFINYPTTKTIRLAKVANNTFDSVADANVRKYLEGLEFKFEDQIFGDNGYNETITIDSSWTVGKSNGYKYLYKDIDVLASDYTITESIGDNIYYEGDSLKTYYSKTLKDVLDTSKRIQGNIASLNAADGETEVYFFNTAKPTKLALYKAVQGNMEYSSILKLVAGTKFVLTNKTTGSITTIVVPDKYNVTDEFGGKWGAYKTTLTTGETYTVMTYAVYGLEPGEYDIKEIPNENFNSSQIFVSSNLTKANENKTNGTSSDTYSFVMSKPFIETSDVSPIVFINTLDTKTIRISKVANNTFANLQTSTILNYLKGLQFDINNTLISGENFSKTVTIDDTWSVATSGNYKYAYKDIEVPAGIYAVEESIGSNTTFDAELTETYYQTSVENVLDTTKRQQGTLGAVTTSDGSNEICFFNTAGSVKLIIYKAVQGSLSKAAMVDLVKGTKFEIRNNITNDLTTVTVGEDACVTADEYGRKWGYSTKTGSDGNVYTLLQYVIEGFDPGQYNIKEIPNDNFVQSEIRVNTSLAVTIGSQPKDNINFTAHKPNTMSNATYSNLFLNTLATKTMRIVKLADNIYDTTTDANVRAYLNGLQFTITDNYFKDDGYSDALTIDDTWTIVKDTNNKVKYVYKDVEVPVSSYSIEETAGTNTMYDLTKTYNQRTLSDVLDTAKRTLGTKTTVNLANNEKDVYFYNSAKPGEFVLSKLVEGVKDETELRRLVNGTKFVLTNDRTSESVTYTIDSSWLFRTRSSSTGIVYGELYKTLDLDANKYTLKEVVNGDFEQDKIRIDWSVDKAEASEYRDTTTFTIVDPTKTLARYFINTQKTATIKLAKLADVTSSKISDDAVYKVLNGLDINVKSLNFNETYTIDNTWSIASGNGYKYLYKEITVPYGTYTVTETTGTNTNFDMSNVYNSEALEKVINTNQRNAGSSFKLIVDSASEKAYIFNTAKLATTRLVKIMDETTSAYIHKVADGTKFIVTGTDFVGRSVNKTFTVDSNWKYNTATYDSQKYSYLYLDIKLLPGSYTIAETTNANCDSSKVTTGAGLQAAIKSTTPGTTIKLTATSTDALYWRVFYNHLKETTLYLSKIGENINSKASYSETHKFLDGLQFKVSGNTALGEVYDKTFTINSDWYISTAGNYRKLTYNLSLPYGSYTFTELSGSNNKYDLNKTKFAYNSTDILNEAVRKTGTSTSITISSTTSYGLVFLNVLKEKPEYSISDTTASTPDSSLTGTIETHVVNGAEESYNDGTDIPVIVIIKDKDGNEEIIATEEVDLKAGEEKDLTFSVIYPNDIKPEEYEIEVRINWDDKDKEQDPTNNTDSTVINPYDFAINKVGLKENKASVGGYIELVPEITYSGSKPFTDNNATLQFYVIDSSGNQVGDILSEIKLNSIKDLVDSDGNLNVPPNSTWTIGSDATPLSFLLPDDLVAGQTYQIRARVNWNNRFKELNPNNNEKEDNFSAVTKIDVKIKPNYPNSSYYAGTEVISTFTVDNVANNFNIIPKYLNVKFSVTALLPDGTIKDVPVDGDKLSIEKENVVPKKSTGIVYFKWKIPEKLSDGTSLVGATLNCKALLVANGYKDADPSNDTAVLSKKLYELPKSNVADTNYEENSQAAMDALKADHSAEGIKITNFVNKAISAMEHFDKVTTNKTEDSTTFQYKNLSSWEEWNYKGGKFAKNSYYAKLNDSVNIKADENYMVDGSSDDLTKFKSGYGFTVNAKANATKASARSLPENSYTNAQYSACFFPEYLFSDKKNEYETLVYNTTKKAFEIVNEKYSNSLHYTPIWYPDITTNTGNYPVAVEFTQCWTPAGVISSRKTNNSIKISGNIYEDWYQQQH